MCTIYYIGNKIPNQPKEKYFGNREYKLHLLFKKINIKKENLPNDYEFSDEIHDEIHNKIHDEIHDNLTDDNNIQINYEINNKFKNLNINDKIYDIKFNLDSLNKLKYDNLEKINKRATQLLFRLNEGNGKAIYLIGINDDGIVDGISLDKIIESYHFINIMINLINAKMQSFKIYKGNILYVSSVRIYLPNYQSDFF